MCFSFFFLNRAIVILEEVLDVYMSKYMGASRMLGDQLALYWVIKSHLPSAMQQFNRHESFTGKVKGVSVLFLPCVIYNWTPPEGAGQFHGMPLDVKVSILFCSANIVNRCGISVNDPIMY